VATFTKLDWPIQDQWKVPVPYLSRAVAELTRSHVTLARALRLDWHCSVSQLSARNVGEAFTSTVHRLDIDTVTLGIPWTHVHPCQGLTRAEAVVPVPVPEWEEPPHCELARFLASSDSLEMEKK
jgi:hypothetical protein